MKYYGSTYKGNLDRYDIQTLHECNNPYDALMIANEEWSSEPEKEIARLLIVIRGAEESNENCVDDKAYFQFTDAKSCRVFIDKQSEIIWSTSEQQIWNGNAKMMG